eukprot:10522393-Alexandrium_andersonii.AAC.1
MEPTPLLLVDWLRLLCGRQAESSAALLAPLHISLTKGSKNVAGSTGQVCDAYPRHWPQTCTRTWATLCAARLWPGQLGMRLILNSASLAHMFQASVRASFQA